MVRTARPMLAALGALAVFVVVAGCAPAAGACSRNSDCASGSYCSAGGCVSDCTPATALADCDPGQLCSSFGMCVGAAVDAGLRDAGAGTDAGGIDAALPSDAGADAPPTLDAGLDAAADAGSGGTDAGADAGPDAGATCAISIGDTIVFDGTGDLAAYPSSQMVALGATVATSDALALTWDRTYLYVTVTSDAFLDAFAPLHLYVEARTTLAAAVPSRGKEYSGLIPELPFTATHLVAVRRTSDSGTGAYNGLFLPSGTPAWLVRSFSLDTGTNVFSSSDLRTLSVRVPWVELGGCPTRLRLAAHVVRGTPGAEWTDVAPSTHTPWLAPGGGYYEIDLTGDPAVSGWTTR